MKPSEVLLGAKDRIIDGWVGHAPPKDSQEHCTLTAIGAASGIHEFTDLPHPVARAKYFLYQATGLETQYGLAAWNDERGRTKEQVIDAFDAAIRLAKDGGE